MTNALHTGQYIDLQTVPVNLDPKHKPRDAGEAFLRALVFVYGFDRNVTPSVQSGKDQVEPFIKDDALCAAVYAFFHVAQTSNQSQRVRFQHAQEVLKPHIESLEQRAKQDEHYALVFCAKFYELGLSLPQDKEKAEAYYRRAIELSAASNENGKGDALANYYLNLLLRRENAENEESEFITMRAADGGIVASQFYLARVFVNAIDESRRGLNPLTLGKTREELVSLAEHYYWLISRHGLFDAQMELMNLYASENMGDEKLEPLFQEMAKKRVQGMYGLARLCERRGCYREALELFEQMAKRPKDSTNITLHDTSGGASSHLKVGDFSADLKVAEYYADGKTGVPADARKAFIAVVTALKSKDPLSQIERPKATVIFERFKDRAWITAKNGTFQRFQLSDNINDPSFVFLPDDPNAAFTTLRSKAQPDPDNFNPRVPKDLAIALAERYEQGLGTPPDMEMALRYHRRTVTVDTGAVASMMAIVEHSGDLVEIVKLTQQLQPAKGRSRINLTKDQIDLVRTRQAEIFAEGEGQLPRVWVPEGKGNALRPITRADTNFNRAVMAPPAGSAEALAWYEEAARNGSTAAAAIVAKLRNPEVPKVEVTEAPAPPSPPVIEDTPEPETPPPSPPTPPEPEQELELQPAPEPEETPPPPEPQPETLPAPPPPPSAPDVIDTWSARLDEAERYARKGEPQYNPQQSYNLLVEVYGAHPELPAKAVNRIVDIRKMFLPDAWQEAAVEVIYRAEGSVHPDLKFDDDKPLYFFQPDYDSLHTLRDYAPTAADAAIEAAFRLAKKIGCEHVEPAAALHYLSNALIDPTKVAGTYRHAIVPANSPAHEKLMELWDELAQNIEIRANRNQRRWQFIYLGDGPRDEVESLHEPRFSRALENFLVANYRRIGRESALIID